MFVRSYPSPPPSPDLPASWLRLKYPHIVHGAIAASAPVLALEGLRNPTPDPESFAEAVTKAAGPDGGAPEECSQNVRRAFAAILSPERKGSNTVSEINSDTDSEINSDMDSEIGSMMGSNMISKRNLNLKLSEREEVAGINDVARLLRVCPGDRPQSLVDLAWWARSAFDYLSMGNFPYASGYILNSAEGGVELPPWPLRVACSHLADADLKVTCAV